MLIDIHCHANLYLNLEEIIKEAISAGVEKTICVGMSSLGLKRVIEVSDQFDSVYLALGIHPEEVEINRDLESQLDSILKYIKEQKINLCAIGEIGLDHHFAKKKELYPLQKMVFGRMLSLAQELELPVNLHVKGAEQVVFDMLPSYNLPNINIHWYSGPEALLKIGIDRGYYFSITPAISYSPVVKKVAETIDKEHLLLESDGPVKYSGKVGTPSMVRNVLNVVAKLRQTSADELEGQIQENAKEIFPKIFV